MLFLINIIEIAIIVCGVFRSEVQEKCVRLQSEAESAAGQLEQAELKASAANKHAATLAAQHAEAQVHKIFICNGTPIQHMVYFISHDTRT